LFGVGLLVGFAFFSDLLYAAVFGGFHDVVVVGEVDEFRVVEMVPFELVLRQDNTRVFVPMVVVPVQVREQLFGVSSGFD